MEKTVWQHQFPQLAGLLEDADHVDVKVIEGDVLLREFVAGMFSYYPGWIKNLYRVRWGFVRLLGMKQEGVPQDMRMRPEDVSMTPGEQVAFFTVDMAADGRYWVASVSESHLSAYLGVVVEQLAHGRRFHVITIVHYHNWAGPVYFNVIRPFHHLVVRKMAQSGVASDHNLVSTAEGL